MSSIERLHVLYSVVGKMEAHYSRISIYGSFWIPANYYCSDSLLHCTIQLRVQKQYESMGSRSGVPLNTSII